MQEYSADNINRRHFQMQVFLAFEGLTALVAQLDVHPTGDNKVVGLTPHLVGNILSWTFDPEITSTVILSLLLIQEGQLSVSAEEFAQYWFTA